MKQGGRLIIISPDATKEFTKYFINKYHPNEAGYALLHFKVTVDGIDGLVHTIKPHSTRDIPNTNTMDFLYLCG